MICRVHAYINNGWANDLVDPDRLSNSSVTSNRADQLQPDEDTLGFGAWLDIKKAYKSPQDVPAFNDSQVITYLVTTTAADGLPAGDFKSINQAAKKSIQLWTHSDD